MSKTKRYLETPSTKFWRDKKGRTHREGAPAVEFEDGGYVWARNGRVHRIGAPAVWWNRKNWEYYENGKKHRLDGPAKLSGGRFTWWVRGKKCNTTADVLRHSKFSKEEEMAFIMKFGEIADETIR